MARLRWLQVNRFRTVKPGTRLSFNPGYNVLLGQNGTGKTTLLNLVSAAVRMEFTDFKDEEFDLSFELESDEAVATISVLNERRASPLQSALEGIAPEVLRRGGLTLDSGFQSPVLSCLMNLQEMRSGLQLRVKVEGSRVSAQRVDPNFQGPAFDFNNPIRDASKLRMLIIYCAVMWRSRVSDAPDILESFVYLGELSSIRFDESLEHFGRLGQFDIIQTRSLDGSVHVSGDYVLPDVVTGRLVQLSQELWGEERYVLGDADLPFLKHATQLLDFESAEAIVEMQESSKNDEGEHMRLGNLRFIFTHRGGWKITEKSLSYGQKRMLAFMFYVATVKSVAIADELVNGLHHRWIRACIETLGDRQVFLTSQNPLLLDYLTFESPEEVRSKFVLCRWEKGPEQMAWENMSQEAAEDFYDSYKVGFQQVGELLQSKGLW